MQWWLLDAVSSKHSLSVLLSAVETCRAAQLALALARWPLSEIIRIHERVLHMSSCGYYSRAVFISLRAPDCAATIRGRQLFEGGVYSKKYGTSEWEDWMKSECASMHEQGSLGACSTLKMRCSEITSSAVIGLKMLLEFQSKEWPQKQSHATRLP